MKLPAPAAAAAALSVELARVIEMEIEAAGGAIPFSRFMELCLYAPGLGYYSAGLPKFGTDGDFVTAPEITSLFGRSLARSCAAVLETLDGGDILEFGAGTGKLALDLLGELDVLGSLPERYFILERSAELRQRQQQALQTHAPRFQQRVVWLEALPEKGFRGVMLANEVLDAMAVERFHWDGDNAGIFYVVSGDSGFAWQRGTTQDELTAAVVGKLAQECALAPGYVSEVNTGLQPWLQGISERLARGLILLIDYGYPRREYYHPQRTKGTLMCHYRQRAHDDPLLWPGLQDITAHVDFTAVAEAAAAAGLNVSGYTTQAYFLLDCGLEEFLRTTGPADSVDYLRLAQQAKTLLLPGEMGERFKCIGLTRGMEQPVHGFRMHDQRGRL